MPLRAGRDVQRDCAVTIRAVAARPPMRRVLFCHVPAFAQTYQWQSVAALRFCRYLIDNHVGVLVCFVFASKERAEDLFERAFAPASQVGFMGHDEAYAVVVEAS